MRKKLMIFHIYDDVALKVAAGVSGNYVAFGLLKRLHEAKDWVVGDTIAVVYPLVG